MNDVCMMYKERMKTFSESLREQAMEISSFKKKKK